MMPKNFYSTHKHYHHHRKYTSSSSSFNSVSDILLVRVLCAIIRHEPHLRRYYIYLSFAIAINWSTTRALPDSVPLDVMWLDKNMKYPIIDPIDWWKINATSFSCVLFDGPLGVKTLVYISIYHVYYHERNPRHEVGKHPGRAAEDQLCCRRYNIYIYIYIYISNRKAWRDDDGYFQCWCCCGWCTGACHIYLSICLYHYIYIYTQIYININHTGDIGADKVTS